MTSGPSWCQDFCTGYVTPSPSDSLSQIKRKPISKQDTKPSVCPESRGSAISRGYKSPQGPNNTAGLLTPNALLASVWVCCIDFFFLNEMFPLVFDMRKGTQREGVHGLRVAPSGWGLAATWPGAPLAPVARVLPCPQCSAGPRSWGGTDF